ncbi:MAG TPA: arginine deiminase-related protein [Candidatus Saccharimonadales bacterium]|nr:arginine deiminase-related protein [Candidatus Saccharimonadales bacterium]
MTQYTTPIINKTVLMSGPRYFGVEELNPFENKNYQPDPDIALREFLEIKKALERAGITVIKVDEPEYCQDGIFTANWGLCRGDLHVLSSLPEQRKNEEPYAEKILQGLGKKVIKPPYRFSGQGDALPCGDLLFAGMGYRNDPRVHQFLTDTFGFKVIGVQAVPLYDDNGKPAINKVTGLPDSYFYDIDLAISILRKDLIAWCPEALMPDSQKVMRELPGIDKIEVSLEEAMNFGCNLVSTGSTVIMGSKTPNLKAAIESHGLNVVTVEINELSKAGGFIRCTTLTLDNE